MTDLFGFRPQDIPRLHALLDAFESGELTRADDFRVVSQDDGQWTIEGKLVNNIISTGWHTSDVMNTMQATDLVEYTWSSTGVIEGTTWEVLYMPAGNFVLNNNRWTFARKMTNGRYIVDYQSCSTTDINTT